jgi:hypothetical protein
MTSDDGGSMAEYYSDPADEEGADLRIGEPTGELIWPPAVRQIALEGAVRLMAGRSAGGFPAQVDGSSTIELAKRFEQYLTTGT